MANKPRTAMPIQNRAKQFMPFSALTGLSEALAAKEKITVDKPLLTDDSTRELDYMLQRLKQGNIITVTYYYNGAYRKLTGIISGLDTANRILQIVNTEISFDDILRLE